MSYFLPLLTGFIVGVIFSYFRLPIPAPTVLPGILGIFGIWLGYQLVEVVGYFMAR